MKNLKAKQWLYIAASFLILVVLNLLLVYFEKGHKGSNIQDIMGAFWYMAITLTTVGYGDMYPVTWGGRIIGFIYVFASLGLIGFLISSLSTKYAQIMEERRLGLHGTKFTQHILIIGWNDFSKLVADEIYPSAKNMAIVTNNKNDIDLIHSIYNKESVFVLFNEHSNYDALNLANAQQASVAFVNLEDDSKNMLYVLDFKNRFPHPKIVVPIEKSRLKETFMSAGVSHAIAKNEIASKLVASYIFEPDVADLNNDLLSSARKLEDFDIQEYKLVMGNPFLGMDYLDTFLELKTKYDAVLLGISKYVNGKQTLLTNASQGVKLNLDDYILVMCNGKVKKVLEKEFKIGEGRIS